jgi:hypothetical protein
MTLGTAAVQLAAALVVVKGRGWCYTNCLMAGRAKITRGGVNIASVQGQQYNCGLATWQEHLLQGICQQSNVTDADQRMMKL